jgi:hypothetical protein
MVAQMKKISLTDIGNLAEAIAAVAVILSIVYLSNQIQQNTKAVRASSYQEVANGISGFQTSLAENEDLSRVYLKGLEDLRQLSPVDRVRFEMIIGQLFAKYDVAVYFYNQDLISEQAINPYSKLILLILDNPGVEAWWENAQVFFSENMRTYINELKNN